MILVAGLSPAWQQVMQFENFVLGDVNRAESVDWFASGKVLNVAAALHRLGEHTLCLCPLGGPAGESIRREFAELGVAAEWIDIASATRVCTTLLIQPGPDVVVTELVGPAGTLNAVELGNFKATFADLARQASFVVLTGSLPPETPSTLFSDLLALVPEDPHLGRPVLLDLVGPELMDCLPLRPRFVKPNRHELEQSLGRPIDDAAAIWEAIDTLHDAGALGVAVTDGPRLTRLSFSPDKARWSLPAAAITPVNPIGSGDCFAAGFVLGYRRGQSVEDALRWGVASAAANAERLLTADYDPQRVAQLEATLSPTKL